jgi:hypothetical protein
MKGGSSVPSVWGKAAKLFGSGARRAPPPAARRPPSFGALLLEIDAEIDAELDAATFARGEQRRHRPTPAELADWDRQYMEQRAAAEREQHRVSLPAVHFNSKAGTEPATKGQTMTSTQALAAYLQAHTAPATFSQPTARNGPADPFTHAYLAAPTIQERDRILAAGEADRAAATRANAGRILALTPLGRSVLAARPAPSSTPPAATFARVANFAAIPPIPPIPHDTPTGQAALQAHHDLAAAAGAVCDPPADFASRHEANANQRIHDLAAAAGARCAALGPNDRPGASFSRPSSPSLSAAERTRILGLTDLGRHVLAAERR